VHSIISRSGRTSRLLVVSLLITSLLGLAAAQPQDAGEAPQPTAADLQAFFEGEVPALMAEYGVPGVTVAVVGDGQVQYAAGFGSARLDPDVPATADTPFGTGSVAKMVTFSALMQQVERGNIDLDTDVNEYLTRFQIPDTFDEPITARHLLTHTAGFEDISIVGLMSRDPDALQPLGERLERDLPKRVQPPGVAASYSNYGAALAGYLVEIVSGVPFSEYVETEIFQPLGMERSTFRQPLPDGFGEAYGYVQQGDGFVWPGPEYVQLYPAGSLRMSANDAASFMLLHLLERPGVLEAQTILRMREPLYQPREDMPGMAYGWFQSKQRDLLILSHEGSTNAAHALMALIPETGEGVFIAGNAPGALLLNGVLWEAYLDRYHPAVPRSAVPDVDLSQYTGSYAQNRYSESTIGKVAMLLSYAPVAQGDGVLTMPPVLGPEPTELIPQGEDIFIDRATDTQVFFTRDADGNVDTLHLIPAMELNRIGFAQHPLLHLSLIGVSLLVTVVGLIVLLIRRPREGRREWGVIAAAAAGPVLFILALLFLGNPLEVGYGATPGLYAALTVGNLAALFALLGVIAVVQIWRNGQWRKGVRWVGTVAVIAAVIFAGELWLWNLLGYRL